jgi:hypothetical protein
MTGEDMFVAAVDRQWISRSSVQKMDKLVVATNDGRKATLALPQQPKVPAFTMLLEDGEWKVALSAIFDVANKAMQNMAKEAGMPENEYIFALLEKVSHFKFDEAVWTGPVR